MTHGQTDRRTRWNDNEVLRRASPVAIRSHYGGPLHVRFLFRR